MSIGNSTLGSLGTFISAVPKSSTLAASPHLQKYENKDDFDDTFKNNRIGYMRARNKDSAMGVDLLRKITRSVQIGVLGALASSIRVNEKAMDQFRNIVGVGKCK